MAHIPDPVDEAEYDSASDEDFNPDNADPAAENEESSSSSEDDAASIKPSKNSKRKVIAEDVDFNNSGDEATIKKARKKKRKGLEEDDNDGGEGGLIKTRAQRRAEIQERKPLVNATSSSVDVNALWAQMATSKKPSSAGNNSYSTDPNVELKQDGISILEKEDRENPKTYPTTTNKETINTPIALVGDELSKSHLEDEEATITIKRTYEFAGETMTEERTVAASSAEARLYLEEQTRKATATSTKPSLPPKPGLRRPTKRASMFGSGALEANSAQNPARGPKLTTLEKSKLDWAKHVDQEGITEELDEHRKAKEGYLGRMDFLGRMEMKKEEEIQKGRQK